MATTDEVIEKGEIEATKVNTIMKYIFGFLRKNYIFIRKVRKRRMERKRRMSAIPARVTKKLYSYR